MTKTMILDTNVLLTDGNALYSFGSSNIVLPLIVLEELDRHKDRQDEVGRNARETVRKLTGITKEHCDLKRGTPLGDGLGSLRVMSVSDIEAVGSIPPELQDNKSGDNTLVEFCLTYRELGDKFVFVTRDLMLQIKCSTLGIPWEDYRKDQVSTSDEVTLYSGVTTLEDVDVDEFYRKVAMDEGFRLSPEVEDTLHINQFVVLTNGQKSALARFDGSGKPLKAVKKHSSGKFSPRNKEQEFAMDLLFDDHIKLVSLIGRSGTGKTLNALSAGLEQVVGSKKRYKNLVVCRPVQPVGRDIGFLPGSLEEKLEPWLAPIKDNLRFLITEGKRGKFNEQILNDYFEQGIIEVEALTFIRGRSIANAFMIVDECFPYKQKILTDVGSKVEIGKLVADFNSDKEVPKVVSYNEQTQTFENKSIIGVRSNGLREVVTVRLANRKVTVTDNHKFLTTDGWKEVRQLSVGDLVVASPHSEHQMLYDFSEEQEQIVLGSYLGDGCVSNHGRNRFRLQVIHGAAQASYCRWKSSMFQATAPKWLANNGFSKKPALKFATKMFGTKLPLPTTRKSSIPHRLLQTVDARALAIWFMDDGNVFTNHNGAKIWSCSFTPESNEMLSRLLRDKFGVENRVQEVSESHPYRHLVLSKRGYETLSSLVAEWFHPELDYKLHPRDRSKINLNSWQGHLTWKTNKLLVVDELLLENPETVEVFDIEVEDNHNFVACSNSRKGLGGLVAHNCQNMSVHEIKTILTRAGEGTKIVLTGDTEQIDALHLDSVNNGLSVVVDRFKDEPIAGHVTLIKGERSALATISANRL